MKNYLLFTYLCTLNLVAFSQEEHSFKKPVKKELHHWTPVLTLEAEFQNIFTFEKISNGIDKPIENKTLYEPRGHVLVRAFKNEWGGFASLLVSHTHEKSNEAEFTTGAVYRFYHDGWHGQIGLGAGLTTEGKNRPLCAESFFALEKYLDAGRIEFFASYLFAYQYAYSYHAYFMMFPRKWIGVGFMAQKYGVIGPRIEMGYKGCNAFAAGIFNAEQNAYSCMFGLKYIFPPKK